MMDPDHLYTNNDNLTFYYNILIHLLEKCKESNKENDDADTKKRVLEELKATRTRLREIEMIKERLRRIRKSAKRLKRNKRFLKEKKAIKKKENVERLRANLFEKNK